MWNLFVHAAWRVTVVSVLLGALLPAIFALGVRETVIAGGGRPGGPEDTAPRMPTLHRVLGIACFVAVVAAVVVGITIIVASGLGKQVSFDHVFPTIVDKS